MLLRVRGTAKQIAINKFKLELDIPALYLVDADYNISLRMIMFELSLHSDEHIPHQFWSLSTTAVDKSAVNLRQEIASFYTPITLESDYKCLVYYEPSIKREYKIQLTSIHTAEFILTSYRSDATLEVLDTEILFEISRNARI